MSRRSTGSSGTEEEWQKEQNLARSLVEGIGVRSGEDVGKGIGVQH